MSDVSTQGSLDPFEQRLRFGSFEIFRDEDGKQCLLGKGAFGRTYKARHVFLERTVALKIINDKFLTDATARDRFLVEARAAARLSHPHIAQILDFGETDGILYYAMEYCSGGDLAEYVKRSGPPSVVQTVQIGLQVASALQCAHAAGFIHRDLKPSNVMLAAPEGAIATKLIDFGLVIAAPGETAEPIDPDSVPTIEQRFIGTPLFASPEQLLVQPLDSRSDFFSLGMTLWFLLLGAAPDQGNSSAIVASRLSGDSYAPRLPRKLPRAFQQLLARLLEKRPENRFENAGDLLAAFVNCAASLGLPTVPLGSLTIPSSTEEGTEATGTAAHPEAEQIDAPVEECYSILAQASESLTGSNYEATTAGDGTAVWIHALKVSLAENVPLMEQLRKNVATLQKGVNSAIVRPVALRVHTDRTVIVLEKPPGRDLLTELKAAGLMRLAEARALLQAIANACDALLGSGLPAPELDGLRIFVELPRDPAATPTAALAAAQPRLFPRFLTYREAASLAADAGAHDATLTMTFDMLMDERADASGWQFAALLYRIISGRNCPHAALLSPVGYVAVPALSEEGNRILALAIARQLVHPTCGELLADLLIAEGLMGGPSTRTLGASATTGPGASSHGSSEGAPTATRSTLRPSSLVTSTLSRDSHLATSAPGASTAGPSHTTQLGTRLPVRPLGVPPQLAPEAPPLLPEKRAAPVWLILVPLLALLIGIAWWAIAHRGSTSTTVSSPPPTTPLMALGSGVLRFQGDIPAHTTARIGDLKLPLVREAGSWRVTFDGAQVTLPAALLLEAKGFAPLKLELRSKAELEQPREVKLQRSEGTLVFQHRQGSDYSYAVLRMTAQLPDEQSFVELERFTRGVELNTDGQVKLPTGSYQVTLKGANDRVVRPRLFKGVVIEPGKTTQCELPPSVIGSYTGSVTVVGGSGARSYDVDVGIEPGLSTGWFVERTQRGKRTVLLSEGRLDAEGAYSARIQYSIASEVESQFDQILTLKREPDGTVQLEAFESLDTNPTTEQRLGRPPYPKSAYSVKGSLRPVGN